jgi:hypothetical protein
VASARSDIGGLRAQVEQMAREGDHEQALAILFD